MHEEEDAFAAFDGRAYQADGRDYGLACTSWKDEQRAAATGAHVRAQIIKRCALIVAEVERF
jgi:hypothetical protein